MLRGLDFSQVWPVRATLVLLAESRSAESRREAMETSASDESRNPSELEPEPFMQRVLDNPFLLLFLGVAIPTVLYLLWGVMEVASIPIAK
jgi:hypothetical protein